MRVFRPRSPVTMAVTPFFLSQRKRRRSSALKMPSLGREEEEDLQGIEDHAFCFHGIDGMTQADEEAFQVVFPGFLDLGAFYVDVIEGELLFFREPVKVKTQRGDVRCKLLCCLLEGHEDARFIVYGRTFDEKLEGDQGLPGACAPRDKSRSAFGDPSHGNLIETLDACRTFL